MEPRNLAEKAPAAFGAPAPRLCGTAYVKTKLLKFHEVLVQLRMSERFDSIALKNAIQEASNEADEVARSEEGRSRRDLFLFEFARSLRLLKFPVCEATLIASDEESATEPETESATEAEAPSYPTNKVFAHQINVLFPARADAPVDFLHYHLANFINQPSNENAREVSARVDYSTNGIWEDIVYKLAKLSLSLWELTVR